LLVATGVVDELPSIEGIDALFGRSVHVCPYCDGWEHRNAPIAVFGRGEKGRGLPCSFASGGQMTSSFAPVARSLPDSSIAVCKTEASRSVPR
jgi:hypothetical protein